jgi:putative DNA primase/helicase
VSGFLNFDEKIIATTIKLAHAKVSYSLKGKLANLSDESRANAKVDSDMLKALTSGNPTTVEQKGKEPEEMINYSKMIFAMNQFPMLGDSSRGMERRMIIISFPNPIAEEDRDIELERKITAERDGIFLWILEGLKRIIQTKKITVPPSSLEIVQTIMQSDPLTSFLDECLTILPAESKPSEGTLRKVVYQAYVDYCQANGSLQSMTGYNFSRRMAEKGVIKAKSNGNDYFKVKIKAQVNQPKQGRRHIEETDDDLDNFL